MRDQLSELFLHPVRLRILLALAGNELAPKGIGQALPDVTHATLYRHIARLEKSGLIKSVAKRKIRGTVEQTYALTDEFIDLSSEIQAANDADLLRYFLMFLLSNLQEFALYLEHRDTAKNHDFTMQSLLVNMSDREYKTFVKDFQLLVKPHLENKADKRRTPRTISTTFIPKSN